MDILYFIILLLLDLGSKRIGRKLLLERGKVSWMGFEFIFIQNKGGILNFGERREKLILVLHTLSLGVLIYLLVQYPSNKKALELLLVGGIGNYINRIKDGYVTDFISFKGRKTPVFNLADIYILIGFLLILKEEIWI